MWIQQMDLLQNEGDIELKELSKKYSIKVYGEDERLVEGTDVTIELRQKIDLYLDDIEKITDRDMTERQRELIKDYIDNNKIYRVDIVEHDRKRKEFHHSCRRLRKQWEKETGDEWPTYEENVYVNGKIWRIKGQYYDAHHIIEVSFGGPNVWYNLFPAASPDEHPYGIHDDYSVCTEIFGPIDRRYRQKKKDFKNLVLSVELGEEYCENEVKKDCVKKEEKKREPVVTKLASNVIRIS